MTVVETVAAGYWYQRKQLTKVYLFDQFSFDRQKGGHFQRLTMLGPLFFGSFGSNR
jgi:hypothetical protein